MRCWLVHYFEVCVWISFVRTDDKLKLRFSSLYKISVSFLCEKCGTRNNMKHENHFFILYDQLPLFPFSFVKSHFFYCTVDLTKSLWRVGTFFLVQLLFLLFQKSFKKIMNFPRACERVQLMKKGSSITPEDRLVDYTSFHFQSE